MVAADECVFIGLNVLDTFLIGQMVGQSWLTPIPAEFLSSYLFRVPVALVVVLYFRLRSGPLWVLNCLLVGMVLWNFIWFVLYGGLR